jgi:translation initiation factor IF-2
MSSAAPLRPPSARATKGQATGNPAAPFRAPAPAPAPAVGGAAARPSTRRSASPAPPPPPLPPPPPAPPVEDTSAVAAAPSPAAPPVPVGAETGPVNFDILAVPPAAPAATLPPALNLAPEPVFDVDAAQRAAFAMVQQLLAAGAVPAAGVEAALPGSLARLGAANGLVPAATGAPEPDMGACARVPGHAARRVGRA